MARRNVLLEELVNRGSVENMSRDSVYQTPAIHRRRSTGFSRWVPATILIVVLHVFWLIWLTPAEPEGVRRYVRPGPSLKILTTQSRSEKSVRRIWTPTVLALPTSIGFSEIAMPEEISEGPSLRTPRGLVRFLNRESYKGGDVPIAQLVWNHSPVRVPAELDPEPIGILPTSGVTIRFESGLQIDVGGGLEVEALLSLDLPRDLEEGSEEWDAEWWIQFDKKGFVDHVFLDHSSGDDRVDHAVRRALHQWKASPLVYGNAGWVKVRYQPDDAESPFTQERAP